MKYFATTKCPKCGKRDVQLLERDSFLGKEETACTECGQEYSTIFNCLVKTNSKEEAFAEAGYKKAFARTKIAKQKSVSV